MTEQVQPNKRKLVLQLVGYVGAFAALAALLSLLLPAYVGYIVLGTLWLMFAVSALITGWQWDDAAWTRETRTYAKWMPCIPVIAIASAYVAERDRDAAAFAIAVSAILLASYPPFFAGRALGRRRRRRQAAG